MDLPQKTGSASVLVIRVQRENCPDYEASMTKFTTVDEAVEFLYKNLNPVSPGPDFPDAARYLGDSGDERALMPLH
jgi:hypothetical protein